MPESLRSNPATVSNVMAAQTTMYKIFAINAIRSAIKYSWKATDKEYYVAEGSAYWHTASGYISTVSPAVKTLVQEVDGLLDAVSAEHGLEIANKAAAVGKGTAR